ncbi:MAG: hypothetical protein ACREM6_01980, partial [Vulcanimicrobiaceae bacterium]
MTAAFDLAAGLVAVFFRFAAALTIDFDFDAVRARAGAFLRAAGLRGAGLVLVRAVAADFGLAAFAARTSRTDFVGFGLAEAALDGFADAALVRLAGIGSLAGFAGRTAAAAGAGRRTAARAGFAVGA